MGRFKGRAAITWTSTGSQSQHIHQLAVPLRGFSVGHDMAVFSRQSLDRSQIETFTVSSGAYELVGNARYDDDPQGLIDLVKAGSENKTLTYIPDTQDPAVSYQVKLLSPHSPASVQADGQRGSFGDYQVELRFRKTDETPIEPLTHGTPVLHWYRAGGNLDQATFARDTNSTAPATYPGISSTSDFGYGTVSTAKDEQARVGWASTKSSAGPRDTPVLLLEGTRTNYLRYSQKMSTGANEWANSGAVAGTSEQNDPMGTTHAWLLTDNNTTFAEARWQQTTQAFSSKAAVSVFMQPDDSSDGSVFGLHDTTGSAWRARVHVAWSSGVPTQTVETGTSDAPPEQWKDGWYRFTAITSTMKSTADDHRFYCYPAQSTSFGAGSTGTGYFFGAQVE